MNNIAALYKKRNKKGCLIRNLPMTVAGMLLYLQGKDKVSHCFHKGKWLIRDPASILSIGKMAGGEAPFSLGKAYDK